MEQDALTFLAETSDGDARQALGALEFGVLSSKEKSLQLSFHNFQLFKIEKL